MNITSPHTFDDNLFEREHFFMNVTLSHHIIHTSQHIQTQRKRVGEEGEEGVEEEEEEEEEGEEEEDITSKTTTIFYVVLFLGVNHFEAIFSIPNPN